MWTIVTRFRLTEAFLLLLSLLIWFILMSGGRPHNSLWTVFDTTSFLSMTILVSLGCIWWIPKNETFTKFKLFCNLVKTQFQSTLKVFHSDGGGEDTSNTFESFLQDHDIKHQITCPHTPEQNGLAKRKQRHLLYLTRTMLHTWNLPHQFWADALSTANYLNNRLPSSKTIHFQTTFYHLNGKYPSYSRLRSFGCLCFPWLQPYSPNKLSPLS